MAALDGITAEITYTADTGEKLINGSFESVTEGRLNTGTYKRRPMRIANGRDDRDLGLETSGFELVKFPTRVTDFFDPVQLKSFYYPEVVELVKRMSGASRVVVFDHTLRSGDEGERAAKRLRELVQSAHNDYTEWSGPERVRILFPDEAAQLLQRRFAIIQVWRATNEPIVANPLAMADSRSVSFDDLLIAERRHPGRVGQTYRLKYNDAHRWVYFPRMQREEAIVFKVFDSAKDGRSRFTPHTSFEDPATPAGAGPRRSIEVRTVAFF